MKQPLYFIISLLVLFASCKKNDAQPNVETVQLGIILGKDTTISALAIKEPFDLIVSDENIASARKLGEEIKVTTHKVGYTEIKIIGQNKEQRGLIQIWVSRGFNLLEIKSYEYVIDVADLNVKKEIEITLKSSVPLPINALYGIGYLPAPSVLHVFPSGIKGEEIIGEISLNTENRTVNLSFNNKQYEYIFVVENSSKMNIKGKSILESPVIPVQLSFKEDLTEKFKSDYPHAGVQNVLRIQKLEGFRE